MTDNKAIIPPELPILPVRDMVLFPGGVLPLTVGRESSLALLEFLGRAGARARDYLPTRSREWRIRPMWICTASARWPSSTRRSSCRTATWSFLSRELHGFASCRWLD